jgi:hypothetical protein
LPPKSFVVNVNCSARIFCLGGVSLTTLVGRLTYTHSVMKYNRIFRRRKKQQLKNYNEWLLVTILWVEEYIR